MHGYEKNKYKILQSVTRNYKSVICVSIRKAVFILGSDNFERIFIAHLY